MNQMIPQMKLMDMRPRRCKLVQVLDDQNVLVTDELGLELHATWCLDAPPRAAHEWVLIVQPSAMGEWLITHKVYQDDATASQDIAADSEGDITLKGRTLHLDFDEISLSGRTLRMSHEHIRMETKRFVQHAQTMFLTSKESIFLRSKNLHAIMSETLRTSGETVVTRARKHIRMFANKIHMG